MKIDKVNKIIDQIYNWVLFPILMGFFFHFMHTIYIY